MSVEVLKTSFLQVTFSKPKTVRLFNQKRAKKDFKSLKERKLSEKGRHEKLGSDNGSTYFTYFKVIVPFQAK